MREYQHFGLTGEAKIYLDENCVKESDVVCPNCSHVLSKKLVVLLEDAFYEDGPMLHTYLLESNKKVVKEVIQEMPWSSGPCGFLCLELEDGTRIGEWSEEEIEQYSR